MENYGQYRINCEVKYATYMQRFLKDAKQASHHYYNHMLMKIVMGKFYIQAYRAFKNFPEDNTAILFKRYQSTTSYIFLLVLYNLQCLRMESMTDINQNSIKKMMTLIERIKRKREENYMISVVLVKERKKLTFKTYEEYVRFLAYCNSEYNISKLSKHISTYPFTCFPNEYYQLSEHYHYYYHYHPAYPYIYCFIPYFLKYNYYLLFYTRYYISNLKYMLTTYIDTFGNMSKGTLIYKMIYRSSVSFSINMLLNTINYIIFQYMNNSCYSQIEPCYWTCYESAKRSLVSDRKHVVLAGVGEVCVLEIIFMREIESEDKKEYDMMLADFKRFYKKAKIKIVRITNYKWDGCAPRINLYDEDSYVGGYYKVTNTYLIYKFHFTTARYFPPSTQR